MLAGGEVTVQNRNDGEGNTSLEWNDREKEREKEKWICLAEAGIQPQPDLS